MPAKELGSGAGSCWSAFCKALAWLSLGGNAGASSSCTSVVSALRLDDEPPRPCVCSAVMLLMRLSVIPPTIHLSVTVVMVMVSTIMLEAAAVTSTGLVSAAEGISLGRLAIAVCGWAFCALTRAAEKVPLTAIDGNSRMEVSMQRYEDTKGTQNVHYSRDRWYGFQSDSIRSEKGRWRLYVATRRRETRDRKRRHLHTRHKRYSNYVGIRITNY